VASEECRAHRGTHNHCPNGTCRGGDPFEVDTTDLVFDSHGAPLQSKHKSDTGPYKDNRRLLHLQQDSGVTRTVTKSHRSQRTHTSEYQRNVVDIKRNNPITRLVPIGKATAGATSPPKQTVMAQADAPAVPRAPSKRRQRLEHIGTVMKLPSSGRPGYERHAKIPGVAILKSTSNPSLVAQRRGHKAQDSMPGQS